MSKKRKGCLLIVFAISVSIGLFIWLVTSPLVEDYQLMYRRSTEKEILYAFSTALRRNHSVAYEITDPKLHPRLDEWMEKHEPKRCAELPYIDMVGGAQIGETPNRDYDILFGCVTVEKRSCTFTVDDIVIEDLKVIGWGRTSPGC